jgi:glutamine---fructose-6-phosphate transaminase (isomerizing)
VEAIRPNVMIRQADALAADIRDQVGPVSQQLEHLPLPAGWLSAETAYLTGDGDSYHAACAAAMAFETIAGLRCEPVSALSFLEYRAPWLRPAAKSRPLLIAVSASGGTERAVQAIQVARHRGALTIAVTGTAGSALTRAADRSLVISLPQLEPSPGVRTYQASLLGLLLLAIRLGQARQHCAQVEAGVLLRDFAALAGNVEATADAVRDRCRDLAGTIAGAPVVVITGSGPSYGTALFSAAKLVEAAGVFSAGQDLEEWSHVERWAYPRDMPVFVIAPPGRSRSRAVTVAAIASDQGRQVVGVIPEDDDEIARHASFVLPVRGRVREEFSPLLYCVFACYLAPYAATQLGRRPFQA